jgi:tripartite-type tricarboxylate transporter receptor subunit TctC
LERVRNRFDPQRDLEVMARTAQAPLVMIIAANRPERTLAEVIASARACSTLTTAGMPVNEQLKPLRVRPSR